MLSNNESFLSEVNLPTPCISLSELLFPAFNSLIPQFFENILPYLGKSRSDCDVMIGVYHSLLGFAFKT